MAILFTALGTAIASVLTDFQGFQMVMNFLVMPIFFLSGALFPLNNVPRRDGRTGGHRSALLRGGRIAVRADRNFALRHGGGHRWCMSILSVMFMVVGARLFSRIQL